MSVEVVGGDRKKKILGATSKDQFSFRFLLLPDRHGKHHCIIKGKYIWTYVILKLEEQKQKGK